MTLTKFKREKRKCLLCLIFSVILIISSFILAIYTYNHNNKVKADTMENNALYDNIYLKYMLLVMMAMYLYLKV